MTKFIKTTDNLIQNYINKLPKVDLIDEDNIQQIASKIIEIFEPIMRVVNEKLYFYDGNIFVKFSTLIEERNGFAATCLEFMSSARAQLKFVKILHKEMLCSHSHFETFKDDEIAIPLKNGMLVFGKDGERLQKHSIKYFTDYIIDYDYDENAECPVFINMLENMFDDDETIDSIEEFYGYMFVSFSWLNLEKSMWFVGAGANGKSTLLKTMEMLIGSENTSHVEVHSMSHEYNRHNLHGKLLNISSDLSNKGLSTDVFKKLVSGEKTEARKIREAPIVITNPPKLVMAMNSTPDTGGDISEGFTRRLLPIYFTKIIPQEERDTHLFEKLQKESSGILNFAINGFNRLRERKRFTESKAMKEALELYELQLNHIKTFIIDLGIEEDQSKRVPNATLYSHYKTWCKDSGVRPKDKMKFLADFKNMNLYTGYKNNNVLGYKISISNPKYATTSSTIFRYENED